MNIWYLVCFSFFVHSFKSLIEESQEITYVLVANYKETNHFLECFNLKEKLLIHRNKSGIELGQIRKSIEKYFRSIFTQIETNYNDRKNEQNERAVRSFNETYLNPKNKGNHLIFRDSFCFIREIEYDLNEVKRYTKNAKYFIFQSSSFNFFETDWLLHKFNQLSVINETHSNCIENYDKFFCLNDCFKEKKRLSKYYYDANETGLIYLNYEDDYKSTTENEHNCSIKCQGNDCKTIHLSQIFGEESKTTYQSIFLLTNFDFWAQLIGLFCSITSIYLNQLLSELMKFLKPMVKKIKIKRIKNSEKYLVYLRIIILLITLIYPFYYYANIITNISYEIKNPTNYEIESYLIEAEKINLAICLPINNILTNNYFDDYKLEYFYEKKTFLELEKLTNIDLKKSIEIFLKIGNEKFITDWTYSLNVIFKLYERCFQIKINPKREKRYANLISVSKLIIRHKFLDKLVIYILPKNENLHYESYEHIISYRFSKKEINRIAAKEKCVDYKKNSNCKSKKECIGRYISRKLFEDYKNIVFSIYGNLLVIYKNNFKEYEWNTSYPKNYNGYTYKSIFLEIEKNCTKKYPFKDCISSEFETLFNEEKFHSEKKSIAEIDLHYDVIETKQNHPSIYALIIDILNIQGILFGLNIFKLSMMLYFYFKMKFRLRKEKVFLFLFYLLCFIGFTYHIFFIFEQVLHGDLIHFIYYNVLSQVEMPDLVFCFELKQIQMDKNIKLTGNYLNQLTEELKKEDFFNEIAYLSQSNEWVKIDLESKFRSNEIKIKESIF